MEVRVVLGVGEVEVEEVAVDVRVDVRVPVRDGDEDEVAPAEVAVEVRVPAREEDVVVRVLTEVEEEVVVAPDLSPVVPVAVVVADLWWSRVELVPVVVVVACLAAGLAREDEAEVVVAAFVVRLDFISIDFLKT